MTGLNLRTEGVLWVPVHDDVAITRIGADLAGHLIHREKVIFIDGRLHTVLAYPNF